MDLFPIFLKIAARPCIVIGAGNLAESKIESLQAAHAKVTVIAPQATPRIADLAAAGEIEWQQRDYAAGDLSRSAVDDPPFCDFYFPSVVRRGDLQIAISTAGASPALAQRLRKEINAQLPLDTGDWLTDLGNLRREVTQMEPLNEERKWLLHQLAQREVCGYDQCPSRVLAREHALTNPLPGKKL
jgi:precorrin-2 dehydrogenase/sirohydrochlorin ferrochelatase